MSQKVEKTQIQRTKKQIKFLKNPTNKAIRRHYFKELLDNAVFPLGPKALRAIDENTKNDFETCAKILKAADLTKQLDKRVIECLLRTLCVYYKKETLLNVQMFLLLARNGLVKIFLQMLIRLREKSEDERFDLILSYILNFFCASIIWKRTQKYLRAMPEFEQIAQPKFWLPFYLSKSKSIFPQALWIYSKICKRPVFTQNLVEKHVRHFQQHLPKFEHHWILLVQNVSDVILESEQRQFFLNLICDLPEKSQIIATSQENILGSSTSYSILKCSNCKKSEKSNRDFKKCSRCGLVFYCSKACQKEDWKTHKDICNQK